GENGAPPTHCRSRGRGDAAPPTGGLFGPPEFSSQRRKRGRRFAEARGARSSSARAARCEPRELLARVKSVLRRATGAAPATAGPRIRMGCRVLDLEKRVLVDPANGQEEILTRASSISSGFSQNTQ